MPDYFIFIVNSVYMIPQEDIDLLVVGDVAIANAYNIVHNDIEYC